MPESRATPPISGGPVGVVGLGNMGLPMARNLVAAGHQVVGFDVREAARVTARNDGISAAASLRELAQVATTVCVMVFDEAQARDVIAGSDGLVVHLRPGSTIVLQSTVTPEAALELEVRAHAADLHLVDAPVCGRAITAAAAGLKVLLGGRPDAVEHCAPLLGALGEVRIVGGVGVGQILKLANNLMIAGNRAFTYEAARLVGAFGIDEEQMRTALADCTGSSKALVDGPQFDEVLLMHTRAGTARWADDVTKDIRAATLTGQAHGVALPLSVRAVELLPAEYAARRAVLVERDDGGAPAA